LVVKFLFFCGVGVAAGKHRKVFTRMAKTELLAKKSARKCDFFGGLQSVE
jgi:hypothetical protein